MEAIKKLNAGKQLSSKRNDDDKDSTEIAFTLYEDGINVYFDELQRISERYLSGYPQKRIIQLLRILKQDKYEAIINQKILYDRIEEYKRNEKANKDYFAYLQSNGIDFQFWRTMYETDVLKRKTQKESEKTFKDGLDRMRKLYPDHFKKTFGDDDENAN